MRYISQSRLLALLSVPALAWGQDSTPRAKALNAPPPVFQYPPLLHQAHIQGPVRFLVLLDSAGRPRMYTFQIVATYNNGFNEAVRRALSGWRDSTMAGRLFEHTVLFVLLNPAGTDSIPRCQSNEDSWATCARLEAPRPARY
jgi:hypothetical protein